MTPWYREHSDNFSYIVIIDRIALQKSQRNNRFIEYKNQFLPFFTISILRL